ncbi:MAG: LOG family protein [Pseudomonadota bacterium]
MLGGYGTLDELFETLTWAQISEHAKPIGLLNVRDYFNLLLKMIEHAEKEGFIFPEHRRSLICETEPEKLLTAMEEHKHSHEAVKKWMRQSR